MDRLLALQLAQQPALDRPQIPGVEFANLKDNGSSFLVFPWLSPAGVVSSLVGILLVVTHHVPEGRATLLAVLAAVVLLATLRSTFLVVVGERTVAILSVRGRNDNPLDQLQAVQVISRPSVWARQSRPDAAIRALRLEFGGRALRIGDDAVGFKRLIRYLREHGHRIVPSPNE